MKVGRAFHLSMSLEHLVLRLNLSLLISWRHFWMKKTKGVNWPSWGVHLDFGI